MSELEELLEYTGVLDLNNIIKKDFRQKNKIEYQKEYRETNKEIYKEYQRNYHRTYKKKKNVVVEEYIDFDRVWKMLGYSRKDSAKRILIKYFVVNEDYKIIQEMGDLVCNEKIYLSESVFRKFCSKCKTEMANKISDLIE